MQRVAWLFSESQRQHGGGTVTFIDIEMPCISIQDWEKSGCHLIEGIELTSSVSELKERAAEKVNLPAFEQSKWTFFIVLVIFPAPELPSQVYTVVQKQRLHPFRYTHLLCVCTGQKTRSVLPLMCTRQPHKMRSYTNQLQMYCCFKTSPKSSILLKHSNPYQIVAYYKPTISINPFTPELKKYILPTF